MQISRGSNSPVPPAWVNLPSKASTKDRAMSIVELRDVVKRYGPTLALDGISFAVEPGQIVALLGPSGCGKTTTLRIIAGFEHPNSGTLTIDGVEMAGRRPYERNVGLLFQDYALFPHM